MGMELIESLDFGIDVYSDADALTAMVTRDGSIVKKFKGEAAHHDAMRHALDMVFAKWSSPKSEI